MAVYASTSLPNTYETAGNCASFGGCIERHPPQGKFFRTVWCGREDSNFHGLSPTTTSTLRVYQFRHDRKSHEGPDISAGSAPLG
jgi:hypothetical protein